VLVEPLTFLTLAIARANARQAIDLKKTGRAVVFHRHETEFRIFWFLRISSFNDSLFFIFFFENEL
jgi:hypothetical protein